MIKEALESFLRWLHKEEDAVVEAERKALVWTKEQIDQLERLEDQLNASLAWFNQRLTALENSALRITEEDLKSDVGSTSEFVRGLAEAAEQPSQEPPTGEGNSTNA